MATFDIFNNDAFAVSSLSQTITDIPRVPTQLGDDGLFNEYGISTTHMMIERQGSSLTLVPAAPRGGVRQPVSLGPRKLFPLSAICLPQSGAVLADEVQNIRAFGSETEVLQVQTLVRQKLQKMKAQIDLTLEYHRIGAVKGIVLDADGTTVLYNLYTLFGMTQTTMPWNIATAGTAVETKSQAIALKRLIRQKMGGRNVTGYRVLCSESFFDALIAHNSTKAAWAAYRDNEFARTDQTADDFIYGGVAFRVYSGGVGGTDFIPAGEAYAYPLGVPSMFQTAYAPADYMETVNTLGIPYYAKQELMRMGIGVELDSQSNPITFNSLPEATIKLTAAA